MNPFYFYGILFFLNNTGKREPEIKEEMVPIGSILLWSLNSPPDGWLLCNGQEIERSTELGQLLVIEGCPFGTGNGTTTVNVPNFNGRFPHQADILGETGGSATHTLTINEIPAHTHSVRYRPYTGGSPAYSLTEGTNTGWGVEIGSTGEGQPHNNLPPYLSVRFIIKYANP